MSWCRYTSYPAQLYQLVHLIPLIVPIIVWAASFTRDANGKWGMQIILVWFAKWITATQLLLRVFQAASHSMRHDPYCPDIESLAVPSAEAFSVFAIASFVILFTYLWNMPMSSSYWAITFAFLLGPPGVLIWFNYNSWHEILIAALLGVTSTAFFVIMVRFVFIRYIDVILKQPPWTWCNCVHTYQLNPEDQDPPALPTFSRR